MQAILRHVTESFLVTKSFIQRRLRDRSRRRYSPDLYRVVLAACLACVQRGLSSFNRFNQQLLCVSGFLVHQHREIDIHIFIQVNVTEDDSGVKRGRVSGEFKVSSRELQTSKAKCDSLDNPDYSCKKKK